ncbi:metallophosphoesterase family protein [Maribellus sp. YY47]|uniref:metallophosphoesterase family protein n=1 Tax=Maribellus sp. YY47 TaxID=2929486 RepID=UPI002000EB94|nr:metallophosphoesterase family protein [Maribellus sp. YY47]MCK3682820.1 metallophosphoesterase family protein [Maribellus sp. YY47]
MTRFYSLLFLLQLTIAGIAQTNPDLKFNASGEFKILQFTDTHINLEKEFNRDVFDRVKKIVEIEKPDLVVLTGDIITSNDPREGYLIFEKIFVEAGVSWTVVLGNHDAENGMKRDDLAAFIQQRKLCLNNDKGETDGNSNFVLTLGNNKTGALLYFMDSNAYSTLQPLVGGWGWFTHRQVEWYRDKSREFTRENEGKPYPALAFFHIPLPEYVAAWQNKENPPVGVKNEDECSPEINTGMFAAMLESGDVMGTFVGHDHINDYIGVHYGIALAYGRISKKMKGEEDPLAGGRVIVMKDGQRSFDTWIRDMNGKKELECSWPSSFNNAKNQ